ncbi:MAG TPA: MFS transporter [Kofleriaceae bacterium]|nr:MFS transporter [Kofleriaceae bacterium]
MTSTRALLANNRDFRRLVVASVVSLTGDWFSFVAVASLVTELTGRAGAAAYVYAATVIPVFVASPFAGIIADRFDRRRTLVIVDLVRVPIALSLCLAAYWHSVTLAITSTILLAVGASFSDPIASAATPNLVDAEDLASAQALMGAVWGSMLMVGAGIGGVVSDLFGRQTAFAIDAASFAVSALSIMRIETPMQQAMPGGATGSIREALAYIRGTPVVLRLIFAKVGVSAANGTVGLLPAFASRRFAGTDIATGLLFAARGLGAMLGPVLARFAIGPTPATRAIVIACGISTLSYAVTYAVFATVSVFAIAMVLLVIAHLGGGAQWSLSTYGLQRETPDHVRGRVMALDYGLATLAIGASAIAAGVLADSVGEAPTTWILSVIGAVYAIAWLGWSRSVSSSSAS